MSFLQQEGIVQPWAPEKLISQGLYFFFYPSWARALQLAIRWLIMLSAVRPAFPLIALELFTCCCRSHIDVSGSFIVCVLITPSLYWRDRNNSRRYPGVSHASLYFMFIWSWCPWHKMFSYKIVFLPMRLPQNTVAVLRLFWKLLRFIFLTKRPKFNQRYINRQSTNYFLFSCIITLNIPYYLLFFFFSVSVNN